jgi:hypothetical protein
MVSEAEIMLGTIKRRVSEDVDRGYGHTRG